jgi:hypothetical protein
MNGARDDEELGIPAREQRINLDPEILEAADPWPGASDVAPDLAVGNDEALTLTRRNSSGDTPAPLTLTESLYLHTRGGRHRRMRAHAREPGRGRRFAHAMAAVVVLGAILFIVAAFVVAVVANWHMIVEAFARPPGEASYFWARATFGWIFLWGVAAFVTLGVIGFIARLFLRLVTGHKVEEIEEEGDWFDDR